MARQEKYSQAVCLKHSERVWSVSERAKDFSVADERDISCVESFLVDGSCGHRVSLAGHSQLYAALDVVECRLAAHRLNYSIPEVCQVNVVKVNEVKDAVRVICV